MGCWYANLAPTLNAHPHFLPHPHPHPSPSPSPSPSPFTLTLTHTLALHPHPHPHPRPSPSPSPTPSPRYANLVTPKPDAVSDEHFALTLAPVVLVMVWPWLLIHTYTHTHIHTYTHTYTPRRPRDGVAVASRPGQPARGLPICMCIPYTCAYAPPCTHMQVWPWLLALGSLCGYCPFGDINALHAFYLWYYPWAVTGAIWTVRT